MTGTESPLARFDVRTRDPESAHAVLRDAYADFSVRPHGPTDGFDFVHAGVVAPAAAIGRVRYGTAAGMDVHAQPERLIVATMRGGRRLSYESGRTTVRAGVAQPVLMPTAAGWRVDLDDVDVDTLTVDRAVVGRTASSMFGIDPADLRFGSMTAVSPGAARYWRGVVAHVERDVLDDDEVAASPLALAEAMRTLAAATLVAFENSGLRLREDGGRTGSAAPAVLRRAVDYIDEHAGEDIGVDDIAVAARIGVRGLQSLFRRHRDRTPLEELRRVRMSRAHADLTAADPTCGDTVALIATRWGFSNPGRFSVQYRQAHGCSPSETLRA